MIAAIIQARLGSTRFPRKVLAPLCGKPVLAHVIERAARIPGIGCVVVAGGGARFKVPGIPESVRWIFPDIPEMDVLGRYALVAEEIGADVIVRITGDCPLLDPALAGVVLSRSFLGNPVYASNVYPTRTWPDGLDVEVFSRGILDRAARSTVDPFDREHVTPWIQRSAGPEIGWVRLPVDWSWLRLTVDTKEDLAWLETVMNAGMNAPTIGGRAPLP